MCTDLMLAVHLECIILYADVYFFLYIAVLHVELVDLRIIMTVIFVEANITPLLLRK